MKLDQIDKGIPIPPRKGGPNSKAKPSKFEFTKNMEIGDSFAVETQTEASQATVFCKKHGINLTQRQMEWGKPIRLWRVE